MTTWNTFLVANAKFPFPDTPERSSVNSTHVSAIEGATIHQAWRATLAVRDEDLTGKLCRILQHILADDIFPENHRLDLLTCFSPMLSMHAPGLWLVNDSEGTATVLLILGVFNAAIQFLRLYGGYDTIPRHQIRHPGARSVVDFVMSVDDQVTVLCEAKSPSVMKRIGDDLPLVGCHLPWDPTDENVMRNVLNKAAQYLGVRQLEWLFLTSHNHWVICRLVYHNENPFLVYSPMITVDDSSEPFRALLGAILSVVKGVPVQPNNLDPDLELDLLDEEEASDPQSEDNNNDESEYYQSSSGEGVGSPPLTRGHESGLMITSSPPNYPESSQIWVRLRPLLGDFLALPHCMGNNELRMWLTRCIGSGSTGDVWECHCNSDTNTLYAMKIVEVLNPFDEDRRCRLRDEFHIYQLLEKAYISGTLHRRIAPRFYGAFGSDHMESILLDLCDNTLNAWDELSASERDQVFKLVQDLHSIGIMHGDLEPHNIVRVHGGGFYLIDFSQSRTHSCKKKMAHTPHNPEDRGPRCSELRALRRLLQY